MKWLLPDWAYMIRLVVGGCVIAVWILLTAGASSLVGVFVGDRVGDWVGAFMLLIGLIYMTHAVGDRIVSEVERKP